MGLKENIKRLREERSLTQAQLAEHLGLTRSAVTQWETGWSQPKMGTVENLAEFFGVPKSEIIDDDPQRTFPSNAIIPVRSRPAYLPLLGRVHAGNAQEPDVIDERISVPYEIWDRHKEAYFLEVEGNCMSRIYPEGCYVLIDGHAEPKNGSIAVVSIDGADYVMRRLYRGASTLVLSPDSWEEGYEDIVIGGGDERTVEFQGVVVWFQSSKEME